MLDKDEIMGIIAAEMSNAGNDELVQKKRVATAYYHGLEPAGSDIKGRSSVVSTDVADACEWLLTVSYTHLTLPTILLV